MQVLGVVGWSGSGKTSLIEAVLPRLTAAGLRVSTIKWVRSDVDVERPGSDTDRFRATGATDVVLASASRWTLMHELASSGEPAPDLVIPHMTPVDLVLVEGLRSLAGNKIEVHRPALGKPLQCADDPGLAAVASDAPVSAEGVPVIDLNNADAVAGFIVSRFRPGQAAVGDGRP